MSVTYRVYLGVDGPPDYATPALTTSALTATLPPLAPGSVLTAVVRAYDTVSGLEDVSSDARAVVTVGADGSDATGLPSPPAGLTVVPGPGGTATVRWNYPIGGGASGFSVYLGAGSTPDYATPVASAAYAASNPGGRLSAALAGLTGGSSYAVAVRARSAAGEESNTNVITFTAAATGPAAIVPVSAVAVP